VPFFDKSEVTMRLAAELAGDRYGGRSKLQSGAHGRDLIAREAFIYIWVAVNFGATESEIKRFKRGLNRLPEVFPAALP
jgi:hypothetical protein